MKVILITTITPAAENIRGTSALSYHLLVRRDEDIDVEIYSFNLNRLPEEKIHEVENELHVRIHLLNVPKWMRWVEKPFMLMVRVFMRYPFSSYLSLSDDVVAAIKAGHPDGIWIFGEEIAGIMSKFSEYKRVHMGPDSEALYYYRMLGQRFVARNRNTLLRQMVMYPKYLRLERSYSVDDKAIYYVVGEADAAFIKRMNPNCHSAFLRHPHYDVSTNKEIKFHTPIRLLIAGQNNYYMQQEADTLVDVLVHSNDKAMKCSYVLTFLGKGWERHADALKNSGWKVNHIAFAPNYKEEVMKHDIQITPISIGTGTKGKVLDALANGLLVIGTPFAMENIAVENDKSCIIYEEAKEVVDVLRQIPAQREKFEQMAVNGRNCVLEEHDRKKLSQQLFETFASDGISNK